MQNITIVLGQLTGFTNKQKRVFRTVFHRAESDPILKRWIDRVGLDGILGKKQGEVSASGGLATEIQASLQRLDLNSDGKSELPFESSLPQSFSKRQVKNTKKLFTQACADPIFSAWLLRTNHDDLRHALNTGIFPERSAPPKACTSACR